MADSRTRSPIEDQRWIPCLNTTLGTIPAYGVVQILGDLPDRTGFLVGAPLATAGVPLAVNGPGMILAGQYGVVTLDWPAFALYNPADPAGPPVPGQTWGVIPGNFQLSSGRTGFAILGSPAAGVVLVGGSAGLGLGVGGGLAFAAVNPGINDAVFAEAPCLEIDVDLTSGLGAFPPGVTSPFGATTNNPAGVMLGMISAAVNHAGVVDLTTAQTLGDGDKIFNRGLTVNEKQGSSDPASLGPDRFKFIHFSSPDGSGVTRYLIYADPYFNTVAIGTNVQAGATLYIFSNGGLAPLLVANNSNPAILYASSSGKVGINSNSPARQLDVTGDIQASGSYYCQGQQGQTKSKTFVTGVTITGLTVKCNNDGTFTITNIQATVTTDTVSFTGGIETG